MSDRSSKKIITIEARILKRLRENSQLSMRETAIRSGLNSATINHIENGRQDILPRHIEALLPIYKVPLQSFRELIINNNIPMSNEHSRCIEFIPYLPDDLANFLSIILDRICSPIREGALR